MFLDTIMKYKIRKMNLKTYEPENRLEFQTENVAGKALNAGTKLASLSEGLLIFTGWIFYPIILFLGLKEKFREFRMKHEKVVDVRHLRKKQLR